jgi:protein-L-isoaspartate(D-aspartate) O-methyltransferase
MTAACSELPEALLGQLTEGGIMVLPFDNGVDQTMTKITRTRDGLVRESLEKVAFVPLLPGLG